MQHISCDRPQSPLEQKTSHKSAGRLGVFKTLEQKDKTVESSFGERKEELLLLPIIMCQCFESTWIRIFTAYDI